MTGSLREILPRQELRKLDRKPGAYPTMARTGDRSRTGRNSVFYDDLNTVVFVRTGSLVTYPTTLTLASPYIGYGMVSNITASGADVDRNAAENWISIPEQVETFTPFVESRLFEQNLDKTGSFYLTGTDYNQVGLGFNSSLGTKTAVRITIPITIEATMDPTSASVFYLNTATGRFEQVATNRKTAPTPSSFPMQDVMLFGPFGNNTFGGFQNLFAFQQSNIGVALAAGLSIDPTDANFTSPPALADPAFKPTASHLIDMSSFLSQPFLLEKAVIQAPVRAGSGWFNDTTQFRSVSTNTTTWTDDGGGPCVVFSLLNSFADRRDLIMSATVIPTGDNTSNVRSDAVTDTANQAGGGIASIINLRSFNGFSATGTPTAVLQSGSDGTFTGSIKMNVQPVVSNGVITQKNFPTLTKNATFAGSFPALINVFGRSGFPSQPSGRSYFGKEYTSPSAANATSNIKQVAGVSAVTSTFDYPESFFYERSQVSPYLIFPTDKLVIAASKHRPINVRKSGSSAVYTQSLSHDFVLATGSFFLTLYGSLVSNAAEFHDTLNQRLETAEVHEVVGFDPVVDQFQVEYFQAYTGSMLTEQLTGSIVQATSIAGVYASGSRFVWVDAARTASYQQRLEVVELANGNANYSDIYTLKKERYGLFRQAQLSSQNERFYDSLIPQLETVSSVDNTQLLGVLYVSNPCTVPVALGAPVVNVSFDFIPYPLDSHIDQSYKYSNVDWTKSFPFEPKYSSVLRILDARQIIAQNTFVYLCGTGYLSPYEYRAQNLRVNHTLGYSYGGEAVDFFNISNNSIRLDTFTKLVYGFGDTNTYPTTAQQASIAANCQILPTNFASYGCTNAPTPRGLLNYGGLAAAGAGNGLNPATCLQSNTYRGAVIRGWKYGLVNGLPQYTKAVFNARSFGQPRDMLEQRQDTKFYEAKGYTFQGELGGNIGSLMAPVQVKFFNQKRELTKPEFTFSSNLSTEATSSLPYFDGVVRNREEPLNLPGIGLTVVT